VGGRLRGEVAAKLWVKGRRELEAVIFKRRTVKETRSYSYVVGNYSCPSICS